MTEVLIGMRRARARALASEILSIPDDEPISIAIYAQNNVGGGEVIVSISNEDMERDDVGDDIYVDIEQD